jgi:protein-tyrosine phosphatase
MTPSCEIRITTVKDVRAVSRLESRRRTAVSKPVFQIALICTGNRFRSPLAEGFLRKYGDELPLSVQSFGTKEVGPLPPLREALEAAATYGLELDRHRACSLGGTRLTDADLVIGFERRHVATAVVDAGAPRERTFTLPELAGLLALLPTVNGTPSADRARERVARAHKLRPPRRNLANLAELADPLGGPPRGYSELAGQLSEFCQSILRGLFGDFETLARGHLRPQLREQDGRP